LTLLISALVNAGYASLFLYYLLSTSTQQLSCFLLTISLLNNCLAGLTALGMPASGKRSSHFKEPTGASESFLCATRPRFEGLEDKNASFVMLHV
jgi:hypothetical protein